MILHGLWRGFKIGGTSPPLPGWRMKAIRVPSGDHLGDPSRQNDGSIQVIGWSASRKMPIKECPFLPDTNARRVPSGDQRGDEFTPRAVNSCEGSVLPSIGTPHTCPLRVKATRRLSGEMAGSSPSPSRTGRPPVKGILHICTLGGSGSNVGFTGSASSQLDPKSPPRIYTTHRPSGERDTLESAWPSSRE